MIVAFVNMAPLFGENQSLFDRKKCLPAWLRAFFLLQYPALLWMHRIILLAEYVMIASSCVRWPGIKIGDKKIAPNAIFRVVSCLYILYDLTCLIWLKNFTHSYSYKAYHWITVFFTSDWLVTHSSPRMIKPQWCQISLQSVALCQTACHILLLSHLKCSYEQSET